MRRRAVVRGTRFAVAFLVALLILSNGEARAAQVEVSVVGGYDQDPRDGGRPVVLIAAALGVPAQTFREAFTHVRPAPAGQAPDPAQVHRNKQALLSRLSPYGVTNELLDRVSDYYRYNPQAGQTWPRTRARIVARVVNGQVTGFTVVNGGSGYTSPPRLIVPGFSGLHAVARLSFGRNLATNGTITGVDLSR